MPNTPSGKAKSRLNAIKHGVHATDELLLAHMRKHERASFEELRSALHETYKPQTEPEKLLVDRIAIQHFRLYRLYALEYRAGTRSTQNPLQDESILKHLDRLSRYDWRIERALSSLQDQLQGLYFRNQREALKLIPYKL